MKKTIKLLSIITLVAVIWFSTVSCGSDDDSGGGGGGISGNTIATGAEVIYAVTNLTEAKSVTDFSYFPWLAYKDEFDFGPLSNFLNGSPKVTVNNSKVTIILGTPKSACLENLSEWFDEMEGVTVSPSNAKVSTYDIQGFLSSDRKYELGCLNDNGDEVSLIYVDRDVTIKGTYTETEVDTYTETDTYTYNLSLKKGWNYIIFSEKRGDWISNGHGGYVRNNSLTYTSSTTQPSGFTWVVYEPWREWYN